jgi:hypothetical protein
MFRDGGPLSTPRVPQAGPGARPGGAGVPNGLLLASHKSKNLLAIQHLLAILARFRNRAHKAGGPQQSQPKTPINRERVQ